jgi:hypothetical protein
MDTEHFKNRIKALWGKIRKRIFSKRLFLIFSISFILLLTIYIGSYRHFRNKSIELEEKIKNVKPEHIRNIHIPSGYYICTLLEVGLGGTRKKVYIYPYFVTKRENFESSKWMYYLYYPLIQLEMKICKLKTFG